MGRPPYPQPSHPSANRHNVVVNVDVVSIVIIITILLQALNVPNRYNVDNPAFDNYDEE